ncbi:uncharacterized protein LOC100834842 [Brachypodium distachyon]|uniref:uncharacterized protein LOC100834842 n=1 Tax=Brachypodium distachyon TaxID=15368 RepID=UPI0001D43E76|nr:uncharacterized protein LOC100834842 [Brachypodium distachyon]|eukprot:XP_003577123.2 uncharacterized protein LOC100834842 [Brachypodium distachyon]
MALGLAAALTMASFLAVSAAASEGLSTSTYYVAVENKLPAGAGMDLVCRALGGELFTEWSVVPRGHMPKGGRRVVELLVDGEGRYAQVVCSWAYQGNYVGGMSLLDSRWPEAKGCRNPRASGGMCRIVFEDDKVRFEAPGGGTRVIGDLSVKRCHGHWLVFSTDCSYPDHPNPYAGRVLRNALEYFGV